MTPSVTKSEMVDHDNILEADNLSVYFQIGKKKQISVVDGVSLHLRRGEMLGIVGESGSGKTMIARSLLRLLPSNGRIQADRIVLDGITVNNFSNKEFSRLRGTKFSMIFQEPLSALNPSFTVGWQIKEVFRLHRRYLNQKQCQQMMVNILKSVKIPEAEGRSREYPHQFSGGMRQRGLISIALASEPEILIADEPTTALDVTVQADIMDLIEEMRRERSLAVLFISHNLNLVVERCDRIMVMYAGNIMEEADSETLIANPVHPYTIALMNSIPDIDKPEEPLNCVPGDIADKGGNRECCSFYPRCIKAMKICSKKKPGFTDLGSGHRYACHFYSKTFGQEYP
jgi:oligopeptide/dipeptide ABC transporter ATP-binding protein